MPFIAHALPQAAIERGDVSAGALVSITGVSFAPAVIEEPRFGGRVLRVVFDDVPLPEFTALGRRWIGPTREQVQDAIAFGRECRAAGVEEVAVHCLHGKSRSTAIALALMADALGRGGEGAAVEALLARDLTGKASPNVGVVRVADEILGRGHALEDALADRLPRFVTWRAFWEERGLPPRESLGRG
ncbi:hypothetical protein J8J14_23985 [Roseomonas sp. SSH11]|uniref:Tyrosine specific protein phosphatases domain-containing protein n=1 Tax=Pararoseomonas baculiformis TaxID=2820812 RepID=A0ABS4ALA0_9PROT|nr:hypothetical protein [Pararoseomonas baculiformis]MBP0447808.1 hypothetical protein [Pararoseomonas baculiformis]